MEYTQIKYEISDQILTVTLNRPDKLNAFTNIMEEELLDAFNRADEDDDVRVVIVTGAGRAFCACIYRIFEVSPCTGIDIQHTLSVAASQRGATTHRPKKRRKPWGWQDYRLNVEANPRPVFMRFLRSMSGPFSRIATDRLPCWLNSSAAKMPAGPAPTMMTSCSIGMSRTPIAQSSAPTVAPVRPL